MDVSAFLVAAVSREVEASDVAGKIIIHTTTPTSLRSAAHSAR